MISISDKTLLKVINDLDAPKLTKNNYRDILVDLGIYSLEEADDPSSAYNKGKKEFIRITLQDLDPVNFSLVLKDLKGYLSNQTLNALSMDGIEMQQSLIGKYAEPTQEISFLEKALQIHSLQSVQGFLDQSLDNYSTENYEAANSMTRTALEDFVEQIALRITGLRGKEVIPYKKDRYDYPQPYDYRKYLEQTNFLDKSEFEFLNKFYGYSSGNGSHPGISTQSEARLRRFVVISILLLFIEKMENSVFMKKLTQL
jgi:hypothetical protein